MPLYRCHEQVRALKIKNIYRHRNGDVTLSFELAAFAPMRLDPEYASRIMPGDTGYLVEDVDGFKSWTSTRSFEKRFVPASE